MLEFIFFSPEPRDLFVSFVQKRNIEVELKDEEDSYLVLLPEDIDDANNDAIEDYYDEMFDYNQTLMESTENTADDYVAAGVVLNLKDGSSIYADMQPALLNKIMSVLSTDEFAIMVDSIVKAVEDKDQRSFCEKMRDNN